MLADRPVAPPMVTSKKSRTVAGCAPARPGPRHRAIQSPNGAARVAGAGRIKNGRLLDGTAHFAEAGDLKAVADAAAEFLFRTRAAGGEQNGQRAQSEKGNDVSHTLFKLTD